jgi:hypothetical protein
MREAISPFPVGFARRTTIRPDSGSGNCNRDNDRSMNEGAEAELDDIDPPE